MCASSRSDAPAGSGGDAAGDPAGGTVTDERQLDLQVSDMDCADCALRIQDRLRRVDGVAEVEGNPVARRVRVRYDGRLVDPARIRRELGKLGYASREAGGESELTREELWTGREA